MGDGPHPARRLRGRHVNVIPNGVDEGCTLTPAEREQIRGELGVGRDEVLVIAVGRLVPDKAFSDLLAAIGIVLPRDSPHSSASRARDR